MMSDRKQYTAEFKRDAVRLMTEGNQSRGFVPYFECFAQRLLGLAATTKATPERGSAVQATG